MKSGRLVSTSKYLQLCLNSGKTKEYKIQNMNKNKISDIASAAHVPFTSICLCQKDILRIINPNTPPPPPRAHG